jgi:hypothetical protein
MVQNVHRSVSILYLNEWIGFPSVTLDLLEINLFSLIISFHLPPVYAVENDAERFDFY